MRPDTPLEARLDAMVTYLRYSVGKMHTARFTLVHLTFLIVISLLSFVAMDGRVSSALRDHAESALQKDTVEQATTATAVADWFGQVLPRLGQLQNPTRSDLVVFSPFAQAQYRVSRPRRDDTCGYNPQLDFLHVSERSRLEQLCNQTYTAMPDDTGTLFTFQWPTTDAALAAATTTFQQTVLRDDDADVHVTVPLYLDASDAVTVVRVRYNAALATTAFDVASPGVFHLGRTGAMVTLVLAAVSAIMVLEVIVEAIVDFRLELAMSDSKLAAVSLKLLIDVLLVLTSLAWLALTTWLFVIFNQPDAASFDTAEQASGTLQRAVDVFHAARTIYAVWYALLYFRTLFYLRFWSRFAVISDTLVSSAPALIGCLLTFLCLIVAFAAVGVLLYGHLVVDREFRNISSAIVFVFIFLYRGGAIDYTPYMDDDPVSASVYFLLMHFWVQIIVLNVIIGVVASAFSAVVTSADLVKAVTWDPRVILSDAKQFLRRTTPTTEGGEQPPDGVDYITARLPLLRHVQWRLKREVGSTPVVAEDLMLHADMPGYSEAQKRRVVERAIFKASKHTGNSDGIDRGFKISVQDSKRATAMEADFWRQARIIQDLYASVCSASSTGLVPQLKAEVEAVTAAEEDLRRSADLLQQDREALEQAVRDAQSETLSLADEVAGSTEAIASLSQAAQTLKETLARIKEAVESAEINRRGRTGGPGAATAGATTSAPPSPEKRP